jgi:GNAT superfamily N-acetyltransferase
VTVTATPKIGANGKSMNQNVFLAKDDEEIRSCYSVMAELRPHVPAGEFLERVKRQKEIAGYELAGITAAVGGEVKAVAGFRISENLAWGKFLYVDDLVSKSEERSKGYGGVLFDWLVDYARENNCDQFHLDSNVQRFAAHRFYLVKRMNIEAHHFGLKLKV